MGSAPTKIHKLLENINLIIQSEMENLKQLLIEKIADILDSEDVQREEMLNNTTHATPRDDSNLHIEMANAALSIYKTSVGNATKAESALPIGGVSDSGCEFGKLVPSPTGDCCPGCKWEYYASDCKACVHCIDNVIGNFHYR